MISKKSFANYTIKASKSVWAFPAIAFLIVILLTILNVNSSSIGIYHNFFYADSNDSNLLLNKPRAIRSDEWIVNTQLSLSQYNSGLPETSSLIGDGMDMSIIVDAPYNSAWQIFKPHNFGFFFMPFSNALSFKWWFMAWALVVAIYFFILKFFPQRKSVAILLSVSFLFSPFIQWWYQYITLAPIYYGIFSYLVARYLIDKKTIEWKSILLSGLLVYFLVSFALVQYPAFQLAALIVLIPLFVADVITGAKIKTIIRSKGFILLISAGIISVLATGLFLGGRMSELSSISNSAYPGKRQVASGGYEMRHLLSSHLSPLFQSETRSSKYTVPAAGAVNQSESANFLLLFPFLIPVLAFQLYKRKLKDNRGVLIVTLAVSAILSLWLIIPHLDILGKLLFLDKIPQARLILSFGIINLVVLVITMKHFEKYKTRMSISILLSIVVLAICLLIGIYVNERNPGFIRGNREILLLSLSFPVLIFFILRGKVILASLGYVILSIASTAFIHPIYEGTAIISKNPLVEKIQQIDKISPGRWIAEDSMLENFPQMAGVKSLSGVYAYPDLNLWRSIAPKNTNSDTYNRYAHVNFNVDRSEAYQPTTFSTPTGDHLAIAFEPCGPFMESAKLMYIVTSSPLNQSSNSCMQFIDKQAFPAVTLYIYKKQY
jgi:hypothetical protein